jgi:Domain of unknown function (DUF4390)
MKSRMVCGAFGLALVGSLALAPAGEVSVTPVVKDETHVFASFAAPGAFDDDARKVVRSGLLLTFTYTIDLSRPSSVWFDHRLCTATVGASVTYDSLTSRYQAQKLRDGHVTKSEHLEKETDVRDWMTAFDQVPLESCEALEPNADYYVRVRLRMSPRASFPLWPFWRDDASGRKDFTYIR